MSCSGETFLLFRSEICCFRLNYENILLLQLFDDGFCAENTSGVLYRDVESISDPKSVAYRAWYYCTDCRICAIPVEYFEASSLLRATRKWNKIALSERFLAVACHRSSSVLWLT